MLERDATGQLAALRTGEISTRELLELTYARIAEVNGRINAIVALREIDDVLSDPAIDGPLSGLPMAIKDLADTKGLTTTYGSPIFADYVPDEDSPMVARLRKAGARIIGKTNTPEFGLGSHSYNPVYGVTRNPYDLSKSAGGSSGGAGAALASQMVGLADGSDMMGSLRNPAGWNNVFGFRPSFGLVAGGGAGEAFLPQLATNGPMARSVRDLDLLLRVQSESDPRDPHTKGPFISGKLDRRLRIGWLDDWGGAYPMEDGVRDVCAGFVARATELGHLVEEAAPPFFAEALWEAWTTLRSWEVSIKQRALFQDPVTRDQLKPEMIWEVERGLALTEDQIVAASAIRSNWFRVTSAMNYDVLALPSAQLFPFPAEWDWPKDIAGVAMDSYHRWMEVVIPASLTGLPALSIPAGFGRAGLPMGLQLFAHRGQDAVILALGAELEDLVSPETRELAL